MGGDIVLCMSQLSLSARGYHHVLKLAWTITDLAGRDEIQSVHPAEALHASQPAEIDDGVMQRHLINRSSLAR